MKKKQKKKKIEPIKKTTNLSFISYAVVALLVFGLIYIYAFNRIQMFGEYKYCIGEVSSSEVHHKSTSVHYKYTVSYKDYFGIRMLYIRYVNLAGKRFFVKYEVGRSENSEILLNQPVPDNIQNSPIDGWTEIPISNANPTLKR